MARKPGTAHGFAINQAVSLTVVGDEPLSLLGQMMELGATDAAVALDRPLDPGVLLKIRWHRTILFAEVTSCKPSRGDYWLALRLWHVQFESPDLAAGWKQLFGGAEAGSAANAG